MTSPRRWWRDQATPTRVVVLVLAGVLAVLVGPRVFGPQQPPAAVSADLTTTSTTAGTTTPEASTLPCPISPKAIDRVFGDDIDPGQLSGWQCVGDFATVWVEDEPGHDDQLWLLHRLGGDRVDPIPGVFSGPGAFCQTFVDGLAGLPPAILEVIGCQYWGGTPPAGSPQAQVADRQRSFFVALAAGDAATVCSMLEPAVIERTGRPCDTDLTQLAGILQPVIGAGSDPRFVQATQTFAVTAGSTTGGFDRVLEWARSTDDPTWRVHRLSCLGPPYDCR